MKFAFSYHIEYDFTIYKSGGYIMSEKINQIAMIYENLPDDAKVQLEQYVAEIQQNLKHHQHSSQAALPIFQLILWSL